MNIKQSLNFDSPYESLQDGDLVHASNIIIDKDTKTIQNEPSLKDFKTFNINSKIVGHIECNQEFILFFNNNDIYRVNVDGTSKKVDIRWHWCGGKVFGTYTYNVNNELIICISELNPTEDCSLKSINLDKDNELNDYIKDNNDELYTELSTAPIANFADVEYINGSRIKKGTYVFFIRYWIDDYYNTIWFPIGFPVHVIDKNSLISPKTVFNYIAGDNKGEGTINDYYNEDDDYTNTNLNIRVHTFMNSKGVFNKYQLAAIVNGNASTEGIVYDKKNITPSAIFTIDNNFTSISLDMLTNEPFNFYNVKTIDNYRNRVYLANYKINNKNKFFETHADDLRAKLSNVIITAVNNKNNRYPAIKDASEFYKPKVGRRGIYSFYIHYVYSNGTYTDGFPINTLNNGTPTVSGTKVRAERVQLSNGNVIFKYYCPEDMMFIQSIVFENIPMYNDFVGYFISYENPKYVDIGSGFYTSDDKYLFNIKDDSSIGGTEIRFNYEEFSVIGGATDANRYADVARFTAENNNNLNTKLIYNHAITPVVKELSKTEVVPPNSSINRGKEGFLKLYTIGVSHNGLTLTDIYKTDSSNFYIDVDKNLISLGYIQYVNEVNPNTNYKYGEVEVSDAGDTFNPTYAWNYYWNVNTIFTYHQDGIIFSDINWNPYNAKTGSDFYSNGDTVANKPLIYSFTYVAESHYFLMGKKLNNAPRTVYYNYNDGSNNVQRANMIIDSSRINELYKLDANYYNFYRKIIVNYNKKNDLYKKELYTKTVYRTNVIGDESVVNGWKHISPEAYKIISENKGDITNIVGIDTYLLVHTEKSLFSFNVDNQLVTEDKDVQMLMPDVFEVDYKEMFSSKFGVAGFQDFISYLVGDFGYIFYDKNSKKIYNFNGKSLESIDNNISKFIIEYNTDYINIGYDSVNGRLLFNFIKNNKSCIMSYSLYNTDWISSHSYTATDKFISLKDDFYIVDLINDIYHIKKFVTNDFNDYEDNIYNDYMNTEFIDNKTCSYVDIFFSGGNYNLIKIVDFITYIINKNKDDYFDALGCYIYTNCCYSDYCNLVNERSKVTEYTKPYYDFGRWNFNWFSNKLADIKEQEIVNRIKGIFNTELNTNPINPDNKLMTGKYAIIRFVFRNNYKKVLIKDIQAYFNNK